MAEVKCWKCDVCGVQGHEKELRKWETIFVKDRASIVDYHICPSCLDKSLSEIIAKLYPSKV